jgi:hypothetical protein
MREDIELSEDCCLEFKTAKKENAMLGKMKAIDK